MKSLGTAGQYSKIRRLGQNTAINEYLVRILFDFEMLQAILSLKCFGAPCPNGGNVLFDARIMHKHWPKISRQKPSGRPRQYCWLYQHLTNHSMVTTRFSSALAVGFILVFITVQMFSCVEQCEKVFGTKTGLHRHEGTCKIFTTVQALKIEKRRGIASSGPRKKAKIQQVRSSF